MRTAPLTAALTVGVLIVPGAAGTGIAGPQARSAWVHGVDNPFFPLVPGTRLVYRGTRDGRPVRDVVTVTDRTVLIQGARATAVHDDLYVSGRLFETTDDYYAQDRRGSVHYLGEDTEELDADGHVTSTEGTFRSGVDGAHGGVIMLAHPHVGDAYRQEDYPGHAEDRARILSRSASVTVPFRRFRHVLETAETTPLEPAIVERKDYARGIGEVRERDVRGGSDHQELVSVSTRKG
jgi:hypothetical protein